jgi:hypothetical protein
LQLNLAIWNLVTVSSFATICKQQPVEQYNDAVYCDVMITIVKEIMLQFNILIILCFACHKSIRLAQHIYVKTATAQEIMSALIT